jgi:hypothetical protein
MLYRFRARLEIGRAEEKTAGEKTGGEREEVEVEVRNSPSP